MALEINEYDGIDLIEFVLIANEKVIGITVESLINDERLLDNIREVFKLDKVKNICTEICSELDKILNINRDNKKLINIVKNLSKGTGKLRIAKTLFFKEKVPILREVKIDEEFDEEYDDGNRIGICLDLDQLNYFENEVNKILILFEKNKENLIEVSSEIFNVIEEEILNILSKTE